MRRVVRYLGIAGGIVFAIVLLFWLGIAAYVSVNKKKVLSEITRQLNENLSGHLTIESMEPSLIEGFPGVSVLLTNVLLRDSLYSTHRHDLLRAKKMFVAIGAFPLLAGKLQMQTIDIRGGEIYIYTDTSGYSNTQIFKKGTGGKNQLKGEISRLILNDVRATSENRKKLKLFSFYFKKLDNKIKYKPTYWSARTTINAKVNALIFNRKKGSYIKNKVLRATLDMRYSHESHVLSVPLQNMLFDNDKLKIGGQFAFKPTSSAFVLNIKAPEIKYRNALGLLTPSIASKLKRYDVSRPISIDAKLRGRLKGKNIPNVNISWQVKNSDMLLWNDKLTNANFKGFYSNELKKGEPRRDPNSIVCAYQLNATWRGIDFKADTVKIFNLKNPVLQGHFFSHFALSKLNEVSGSETFVLNRGSAVLNLIYKAPISPNNLTEPYMYGNVRIRDGELVYVPRDLKFNNVNGTISFIGQHLLLRNVHVQSGNSKLNMQGSIRNFVNFYYTDPQKILFDWKIQSPQIHLGEFLAFVGGRKTVKRHRPSDRVSRIFRQLNSVLDQANIHIELKADKLLYKRFVGQAVRSNLTLKQSGINLNEVSLSHGGGNLTASGQIGHGAGTNNFSVDSHLNNVDIRKLFYAFEDFGQTGITYENLRGSLTARTQIRGMLRPNGQTVPKSFFGSVDFTLNNGALVNYEPMERIGSLVFFRRRNFSNITFRSLHNTLHVQGDKIYIPEMLIESSVFNVIVEGVYGIPKGTNIGMSIPIRNPEKDRFLPDSLREKRLKRGVVINLSAVDDERGGVKIKLGKPKTDKQSSPGKESLNDTDNSVKTQE